MILRAASSLVQLLKADVSSVLPETLTAHVQVVFPAKFNSQISSSTGGTEDHEPDETVPVGAASTLPGALAVLPRTAEPDVLVTHDEDRFDFSSETLQSLSHV